MKMDFPISFFKLRQVKSLVILMGFNWEVEKIILYSIIMFCCMVLPPSPKHHWCISNSTAFGHIMFHDCTDTLVLNIRISFKPHPHVRIVLINLNIFSLISKSLGVINQNKKSLEVICLHSLRYVNEVL